MLPFPRHPPERLHGWCSVSVGTVASRCVSVGCIGAYGSTEIKVGVMLSAVPGGVTSNMLTKFGRASVALSISLTAVISLLFLSHTASDTCHSIVLSTISGTPPDNFQSPKLSIEHFLITAVPVALGLLVSRI